MLSVEGWKAICDESLCQAMKIFPSTSLHIASYVVNVLQVGCEGKNDIKVYKTFNQVLKMLIKSLQKVLIKV